MEVVLEGSVGACATGSVCAEEVMQEVEEVVTLNVHCLVALRVFTVILLAESANI